MTEKGERQKLIEPLAPDAYITVMAHKTIGVWKKPWFSVTWAIVKHGHAMSTPFQSAKDISKHVDEAKETLNKMLSRVEFNREGKAVVVEPKITVDWCKEDPNLVFREPEQGTVDWRELFSGCKPRKPWAYVKCARCDASIPVYGAEKNVECRKCGERCGERVMVGRPREKYRCKNCGGEVVFNRGWGHVVATGCINPSVTLNDWKRYLKNRKETQRK